MLTDNNKNGLKQTEYTQASNWDSDLYGENNIYAARQADDRVESKDDAFL